MLRVTKNASTRSDNVNIVYQDFATTRYPVPNVQLLFDLASKIQVLPPQTLQLFLHMLCQNCESLQPKVWSQEPTPATLHASSPLLHATTTEQDVSSCSCTDLSLVWLTLLESEIGSGNSIPGLNNSWGKSKPTTCRQKFLGQKSQNKWRPNCLVSGTQIPRSTNPTN